jgi:hypothetical protein
VRGQIGLAHTSLDTQTTLLYLLQPDALYEAISHVTMCSTQGALPHSTLHLCDHSQTPSTPLCGPHTHLCISPVQCDGVILHVWLLSGREVVLELIRFHLPTQDMQASIKMTELLQKLTIVQLRASHSHSATSMARTSACCIGLAVGPAGSPLYCCSTPTPRLQRTVQHL